MDGNKPKRPRGRPKTVNREHILDVAMHSYWADGIQNVSLNEICKSAKVAKPGFYREFGNEDGLMQAVLQQYEQQVLVPFWQIVSDKKPFNETLDTLIKKVTTPTVTDEVSDGCLLVLMRELRFHLGDSTQKQIELTQNKALNVYQQWIERSIKNGELINDFPTERTAVYLDSQLSYALSQMSRGEPPQYVRDVLKMALSVLQ